MRPCPNFVVVIGRQRSNYQIGRHLLLWYTTKLQVMLASVLTQEPGKSMIDMGADRVLCM